MTVLPGPMEKAMAMVSMSIMAPMMARMVSRGFESRRFGL
jgi:hypothetical protein